jgi:hypothetical protein
MFNSVLSGKEVKLPSAQVQEASTHQKVLVPLPSTKVFPTRTPVDLQKLYPSKSTLAILPSLANQAPSPGQSRTLGSEYFDCDVVGPTLTVRLPEAEDMGGRVAGVRYPELPVVAVPFRAEGTDVVFVELAVELDM